MNNKCVLPTIKLSKQPDYLTQCRLMYPLKNPIILNSPEFKSDGLRFSSTTAEMNVVYLEEFAQMDELKKIAVKWVDKYAKRLKPSRNSTLVIGIDNLEPNVDVFRSDKSVLQPSRFDLAGPFTGKMRLQVIGLLIDHKTKQFKWMLKPTQILLTCQARLPKNCLVTV